LKAGKPLPLGATPTPDGVNFAVFSQHAASVTLLLFEKESAMPAAELRLDPEINRTGHIWHILVIGMNSTLGYAYRCQGLYDPRGKGHWFDETKILLDPCALALEGGEVWGGNRDGTFHRRCRVAVDDFDWEDDRPLRLPMKDSIIYELHVRGYTVDASSGVAHPGTYRGLMEKIPYIQSLGVTAVELMPVFEFNESENDRINPKTGERLKNFWGYNPLGFFAPKAAYASNGSDGNQVREFKEMVKAFHRAGLEVILDVVFNHTAEGDAEGPVISFRGLDNTVYYILDPETREYADLTGCGNTLNCNHPVVQTLILDCLRHWVVEMHVDGFRFDLAPILGRGPRGTPLKGPSLIHAIEQDPVLARTKLIAEAWDGGGNQVGKFPGRWAEWNAFYRDDVRRFLRGDEGMVSSVATRIAGSSDLYQSGERRPSNSINYVTCHDGFTLYDQFSYNEKHNEENGENNRDGSDHSFSSNSGVEGPSDRREVKRLRLRRMKTAFALLMVSQGVPMVLAGDEFCRTQRGNNNPYCQDNDISWVNWRLTEEHADLLRFFRKIVSLRRRHAVFRRAEFLTGADRNGDDLPDLCWHGLEAGKPDWSQEAKVLAFTLDGSELGKSEKDDDFLVIFNEDRKEQRFEIPRPRKGTAWFRIVDTGRPSPGDILEEDRAEPLAHEESYLLLPAAAAIFTAKGA
jgi:glycogen operon protein